MRRSAPLPVIDKLGVLISATISRSRMMCFRPGARRWRDRSGATVERSATKTDRFIYVDTNVLPFFLDSFRDRLPRRRRTRRPGTDNRQRPGVIGTGAGGRLRRAVG